MQVQDASKEGGIVTQKVREAVGRIKTICLLEALFANTRHPELTQGTSGNENWHSWLKRNIPVLGGVRSFFTLLILLAWQMMRFNEAIETNQKKADDKKKDGDQLKSLRTAPFAAQGSLCSSIQL